MCNNTGYRCYNVTKEECDALSLATGVSNIATATLSLSLLVCLLAIKKTNAWNTGIKRATIVFSVYLTLSLINLGAVVLYNGFLPFGYCEVMYCIDLYTKLIISLYTVAIFGMLLIQIGSPVFNGTNCSQKLKSHLSVVSEVFVHVFLSLSSVVFAVVVLFSANHACSDTSCDQKQFFINGTFVAILIMSFVCIIDFVYCHFSSVLVFKTIQKSKNHKKAEMASV